MGLIPPGHLLQCRLYGVVDLGKLGDAHHVEYFFEMTRKTRNAGLLFVLFRFGQNLNEQSNAAAVDVDVFCKSKQNFTGIQIDCFGVSVVEKGFGECGHVTPDVKQGNISDRFQCDFSWLFHRMPVSFPAKAVYPLV